MVQHLADRILVAGQTIDRATLTGIKVASAKSGVSFQYLLAKAAQESSLKPDAQAEGSTAAGLFQFTRGTWLEMVKRYGSETGLPELARNILTGGDGRALVKDQEIESRILSLRENPEVSALMAAHYARDNAASLENTLGRSVDAGDLYLAHFLGATGAGLLLGTAADKPDTAASQLMPAAAKANRSVFYDADGKARTAAEVVALVRARFSTQMTRFASAAKELVHAAPSTPTVSASPGIASTAKPAAQPGSDPGKTMMSWFMMEEMAKLIAAKPMAMTEDGAFGSDQAVSSGGLQGTDWSSAMTQALGKNAMPVAQAPTPAPANHASRAYDAVKTHVAAFINRRRDSHT